jgi:hypothetical protein
MKLAYFTVPISEHLEETPEGYLLARNCVLGRTGIQTYRLDELPMEQLESLGVDISDPSAEIDIFRPPDAVFSASALASGNGKPVTDGHPDPSADLHGDDFVGPDNYRKLACGHVNNLHAGIEPLESGDMPLLGDVLITTEPLISEVRAKRKRQLSLGYDYVLRRNGDKLEQHNIVINHLAVVPKGRAGPEARIVDAAPESSPSVVAENKQQLKQSTTKEKKAVKNNLLHILGLGLKARAVDAEPEELAQAAMELGKQSASSSEEEPTAADAKRKRAHDALDRALDSMDAGRTRRGKDSDIEGLRSLLDEFLGEEEEEPTHQEDDEVVIEEEQPEDLDTEELDKALAADVEEEGEQELEEEAMDEEVEEEEGESTTENPDADEPRLRAADGALAVLKAMRPIVARSKDQAVRRAFNAALRSANGASTVRATDGKDRKAGGSYKKFAARSRARDMAPAAARQEQAKKLQDFYDNARKGGK